VSVQVLPPRVRGEAVRSRREGRGDGRDLPAARGVRQRSRQRTGHPGVLRRRRGPRSDRAGQAHHEG
ncbi:unnamed protein product, partial [Ectocarpus sp. 13 AM-2016]